MPITPFHFGLGAAFKAVAPKHVSFVSFVAANVLIDIEPMYYMSTKQYPLHRFFHTYVGAGVISVAAIILVVLSAAVSKRFFPVLFDKFFSSSVAASVLGAALGSYSHIVLYSIMHVDIRPLSPFSHANDLHGLMSLSSLHWFCVIVGFFGVVIMGFRDLFKSK